MKLFELESSESDRPYCFIWASIPFSIALIDGDPILPGMSENEMTYLDLGMDEDAGGLKLPDRVGNTQSMLILRDKCLNAINEHFNLGEYEVLPARLINEKKRVHADDYAVVNLLERFDCLDIEKSDMDDNKKNPGVQIFGSYWLKEVLIPGDRDLFRVKGVIDCIFSEKLVQFIKSKGFTNFFFKPVQLS